MKLPPCVYTATSATGKDIDISSVKDGNGVGVVAVAGGRHLKLGPPPGLRPIELSTPLLLAALADADDDMHPAFGAHSRPGAFPQPASPAHSMSSDGSVSWCDMDELMRSSEYAGVGAADK